MIELLTDNFNFVLAMACIFSLILVPIVLLIAKKNKRVSSKTLQVHVELSDDVAKIYQKAEHDIKKTVELYQQALDVKLGSFDATLGKLTRSISDSQAKQAENLQTIQKLNAEFSQKADGELASLKQALQEQKELFKDKQQGILEIIKDEAHEFKKSRQKLNDDFTAEQKRIIEQTKVQSQEIIANVNENYKGFFEQIRDEVLKTLISENKQMMDSFKTDLLNIVNQSEEIIRKTEHQAWNQVEQFNSQLLDAFERISRNIFAQSEARADRIGERMLQKVEDDIVAFVIGVVHDTIEMTLTPEQHQEIIMRSVQNMKKQMHLGEIQKTTQVLQAQTDTITEQKTDTRSPGQQSSTEQTIAAPSITPPVNDSEASKELGTSQTGPTSSISDTQATKNPQQLGGQQLQPQKMDIAVPTNTQTSQQQAAQANPAQNAASGDNKVSEVLAESLAETSQDKDALDAMPVPPDDQSSNDIQQATS